MSPTMTALETATRRGDIMGRIQTCRLCSYATEHPVVFRGPTPARLMLIADAPGPRSAEWGKPLVDGAGRWLMNQFREVGLPDMAQWFITYAVKCRPPDDITPEKPNVQTCAGHLRREVDMADPTWIVTLGSVALSSTGVTGVITKCHGRPFKVPAGPFVGRWVFPALHPMQVFRDEKKGTEIISDLSVLKNLMSGTVRREDFQLIVGRNGRLVPPS